MDKKKKRILFILNATAAGPGAKKNLLCAAAVARTRTGAFHRQHTARRRRGRSSAGWRCSRVQRRRRRRGMERKIKNKQTGPDSIPRRSCPLPPPLARAQRRIRLPYTYVRFVYSMPSVPRSSPISLRLPARPRIGNDIARVVFLRWRLLLFSTSCTNLIAFTIMYANRTICRVPVGHQSSPLNLLFSENVPVTII